MNRHFFLGVGITLVIGICSNVHAQRTLSGHSFQQYTVPVYRGPAAKPNFKSLPDSLQFRTRIREGFKNGVNFAGHYAIVPFGCGTYCLMGFLIDVESGRILNIPLGGEENYALGLDYRPTSRLLKARWIAGLD